MSTSAVTLDFSKAQPLEASARPDGGVTLDFSKAQPVALERPSAASRFGSNLLSGLGITSDEQAKQFFSHPIKTFMDSIEAQGNLAKQAKEAYDRGDYMAAVQHGLNYLVPFVGQQTDEAGNQLKTGDIAGGIGRTLGAAAPIVAGSPEVRAGAASAVKAAADTGASAVRAGARGANTVLRKFPESVGTSVGASVGGAVGGHLGAEIGAGAGFALGKELLPQVRIPGEGFGLPGRVTGGPATIPPEATPAPEAVAPQTVPVPRPNPTIVAPEETPAAPPAAASDEPLTSPALRGEYVRGDLAGDSVLRKTLSVQDNRALLQIAKSRGIDVAQESQLKDSLANPKLVSKIIDSFSEDELANVKATNQEVQRNMHNFGDVGPEAWKTMSLKTYFPDLKIPQAVLNRTAKAIEQNYASPARPMDLLGGKQAFKQQGQWFVKSGDLPTDKWVRVTEGGISDLLDALGAKGGKGLTPAARVPAADEDLTGLLDQSVKRARASR